jgi:hypothetical protein
MSDYPPPEHLHYYAPTYLPPRRPLSVSVISWLMIAFCGLGILGGFFIILQREFLTAFQPADPLSQALYAPGFLRTYTIASQIVGWIVNVILFITAIGSLRLKPWARVLMIRMMIFQLFMLVIGVVFSVTLIMPAMAKVFQQNPNLPMAPFFYVTQFVAFGVGLAIPLLVIYYFTRPHVKSAFEEPPLSAPQMPPPPPASFTPQP